MRRQKTVIYIPQPGSLSHRVEVFLRTLPPGTWVRSTMLCRAMSIMSSALNSSMFAAINAGRVMRRHSQDAREFEWALGASALHEGRQQTAEEEEAEQAAAETHFVSPEPVAQQEPAAEPEAEAQDEEPAASPAEPIRFYALPDGGPALLDDEPADSIRLRPAPEPDCEDTRDQGEPAPPPPLPHVFGLFSDGRLYMELDGRPVWLTGDATAALWHYLSTSNADAVIRWARMGGL